MPMNAVDFDEGIQITKVRGLDEQHRPQREESKVQSQT